VAEIEFRRRAVAPAAPLYVTRDDRLMLQVRNSLAGTRVQCWARLQLADGTVPPMLQEMVPATDRSPTSIAFDLAEGYLLSVTMQVIGASPRRGQVWAEASLIRGAAGDVQVVQVLVSDAITNRSALAWPGGQLRQSVEGPGALRSIAGTNPAAGVEVSEAVPTDARWRLRSFRVQLVTAVAVATRRVHLTIDDGATILYDLAAADTELASLTRNYNFTQDGFQRAAQDNEVYVPLPVDVYLFQGYRVRTLTTNLQAADDYGAPQYAVEEWIED